MGTIEIPPGKTEGLRFRAYFWLLNLSLVFALIGVAEVVTALFIEQRGFGLEGTANSVAALIVGLLSWCVPFFLMLARFMRDDYTEALWKRTVVALAYAVAVAPMAFFVFAWGCELGLPKDGATYAAWRRIYEPFTAPGQRGDVIVSTVWQIYTWLFVFIFQFMRWQDSR
jgi:hypothetical protein